MRVPPVDVRVRLTNAPQLRAISAQMDVVAGKWDDLAEATLRLAYLVEGLDEPERVQEET